jgi:hypothetical protein
MQKIKNIKLLKQVGKWSLVGLLAIILLIIITVYSLGVRTSFTRSLARNFPFPAAILGGDVISSRTYVGRLDILSKTNGTKLDVKTQDAVLNKLIVDQFIQGIADKEDQLVTLEDVERNYLNIKTVTGNQFPASSYGLTEEQFKEWVLKPDSQNTKLAIWLASDRSQNASAYNRVDEVNRRVASGDTLEDLAADFSDDALSADIGGSLGFVGVRDLEPEFYEAVQKVNDRNVHTLVSRYGIHLFTVGGKDVKGPQGTARYEVRHIFIKTVDFSEWVNAQKKQHTIFKLL